jgi:hypothetical protein
MATLNHQIMQGRPIWIFYVASVGQNIVSSLISAPVAVAVHRWVLLNDIQPGAISWKPPHTRLFFLWALALRLIYMVMTLPTLRFTGEMVRSGIAGTRPGAGVFLSLLPIPIVMIVSIYLALVFPDVAIGEPSTSWMARAKASIVRVRGNFWLLVRAAILAFLPVIVIEIILALVVNHARSVTTFALFGPAFVTNIVTGAVTAVFGIGLAAATVSWLYSWARTERAEVAGE